MSTLSSSMQIAVTALNAQSAAVSTISNNLANSETIGYKSTDASFYSLVTGSGSANSFTGAGVVASPSQKISQQGLIVGTQTGSDLAIDGDGFFVVTDTADSDIFAYTRAGDFYVDANGYLVNSNGYYLQGYPTDRDGKITTSSSAAGLEPINLYNANGSAAATSELMLQANLPADAAIGDTVETAVEIFDSLGVAHSVTLSYTRTAENEWSMNVSDPVLSSDGTTVSGTAAGGGVITFNPDGTLASTVPDPSEITVTGWSTGAADSTIAYDPGTAGSANGLSQYASNDPDGDIEIGDKTVKQDGVRYGSFYNATISEDGLVYANFDNGISYPIYQIPLATFPNPDGLEAVSGNAYTPTPQSGAQTFVNPGDGNAGTVFSGALESSTVDTADEFSKLIVAQQAYAAASEIISTTQQMFDHLMSAKR